MDSNLYELPYNFKIDSASSWMTQVPTQMHRYHGPRDGVYIDIGAHVGIIATRAYMSGFREIHCYEPSPVNFAYLSHNMSLVTNNDPGVHLHNQGVVGEPSRSNSQEFRLYDYPLQPREVRSNSGMRSGLYRSDTCPVHAIVPAISLTEILEAHQSIEYLKIDIEGGEYNLFQPTTRLEKALRRVRTLSLEIHLIDDSFLFNDQSFEDTHPWYSGTDSAPIELIEYMTSLGFTDMTYEQVRETQCDEFLSKNYNFTEAREGEFDARV